MSDKQQERASRRQKLITETVQEANEMIRKGSDGSEEEINYLRAQVAKSILEESLSHFYYTLLRRDMEDQDDD